MAANCFLVFLAVEMLTPLGVVFVGRRDALVADLGYGTERYVHAGVERIFPSACLRGSGSAATANSPIIAPVFEWAKSERVACDWAVRNKTQSRYSMPTKNIQNLFHNIRFQSDWVDRNAQHTITRRADVLDATPSIIRTPYDADVSDADVSDRVSTLGAGTHSIRLRRSDL